MKLVLLDEAQRRFEAEEAWWREHRDAKDLFADEFAKALEHVGTMPEAGQQYRRARGKLIQRVFIKRICCHVYYFHDRERDVIEIHSVWGARKRHGPTL